MPSYKLSVSKYTLELETHRRKLIDSSFFFTLSLLFSFQHPVGWQWIRWECGTTKLFRTHIRTNTKHLSSSEWSLKTGPVTKMTLENRTTRDRDEHHDHYTTIIATYSCLIIGWKKRMNIFIIYHQPIQINCHLHVAKLLFAEPNVCVRAVCTTVHSVGGGVGGGSIAVQSKHPSLNNDGDDDNVRMKARCSNVNENVIRTLGLCAAAHYYYYIAYLWGIFSQFDTGQPESSSRQNQRLARHARVRFHSNNCNCRRRSSEEILLIDKYFCRLGEYVQVIS